ncbi:MAG: NAD-dependent epimerase/dehydratase family protein [Bacteroidota bacterium]
MKVIITGASGMVGRGVLPECLDHEDVSEVLSIGRTPLEMDHPKIKEMIITNFLDYSSKEDKLSGYDACYLCMGVSAGGLSEEKYTILTYDYTLALAKTLLKLNPKITCIYVSGEGTDSFEKGRTMWARVKGKTENDLLKLGFERAFMFRPGAIIPLRGIKSKTRLYQFMYDYFMWLIKLIKFFAPNSVVNTTQIGISMINVTKRSHEKAVLRPKDILGLAS